MASPGLLGTAIFLPSSTILKPLKNIVKPHVNKIKFKFNHSGELFFCLTFSSKWLKCSFARLGKVIRVRFSQVQHFSQRVTLFLLFLNFFCQISGYFHTMF